MDKNIIDYEPPDALFVSDENPIIFHQRICDIAHDLLKYGGKIYFEIDENSAMDIADLLKKKSFRNIIISKDLNGKERFVSCIR